jgi:hypothetical protein
MSDELEGEKDQNRINRRGNASSIQDRSIPRMRSIDETEVQQQWEIINSKSEKGKVIIS